jgi:hypothetical protein
MVDCGLPLPCTQTVDVGGTALSITNTNTQPGGVAVQGFAAFGVGVSGGALPLGPGVESFTTGVQGSADGGNGVLGTSQRAIGVVGSGGACGVQGNTEEGIGVNGNSTFGPAGVFEIPGSQITGALQNSNPALRATTHNTGPAGVFQIIEDDPAHPLRNANPAILATTSSSRGAAASFRNESTGNVATTAMAVSSRSLQGQCVLIDSRATGLFSSGAPAGIFGGDVNVFGTLVATSKFFVIDHPLDPANSYLVHASVESSEQVTVYTGNAVLGDNGEAVVTLPNWLDALDEDFRYQLTPIGGAAAVYVAREASDGSFTIAGGNPGLKVSWQLVGRRKDAWARAHPLVVEQEKSPRDKGLYRHPELAGQGVDKGICRPAEAG